MPQHTDQPEIVQLNNAEFLPQVVALLNEGHTVTLPLRGNSMRPFLRDGRDKALLAAVGTQQPCVGDVVLAETAPNHFVLHRIVYICGKQVTLQGDGNLGCEHCQLSHVHAKAIAFYRKGRKQPDSISGRKWRIYSWWWTRLYPLRRYLLFLLYPHRPRLLSLNKK